jgi:hypothetical protein
LGQGPRGKQKKNRRDVSPSLRGRGNLRRKTRRRGRDLLGRDAFLAADGATSGDDRSPQNHRLPGRHGAHAALHAWATTRPKTRSSRPTSTGRIRSKLDQALRKLTSALRPWTIDFHVAQNDATVKGSGSHDKTGRHCLASDAGGKLNIPRHAGYWLRDPASGQPTKKLKHICWDGCMFPNDVMMKPQTWNDILAVMIKVREQHGWAQ